MINKMKHFAKFLLMAMSLFVASSCDKDDSFNYTNQKQKIVNSKEWMMDNQVEANRLNNIILKSIENKSTSSNHTRTVLESSTRGTYPDYYGGSYIEPDGHLTIYICGDSLRGVKSIKTITNSSLIHYRKCSYSYNELQKVMADLDRCLSQASESMKRNVCGYGILDAENVVEISLKSMNNDKIQEFKELYSHPSLRFVESGEFAEESVDISPGQRLSIYITGGDDYGSYAFRAREKTGTHRVGMVTAGHVRSVGDSAYITNSLVGICVSQVYSGSVDAAFIAMDSLNYRPSNTIAGTLNELSLQTSRPGVGTYVNLKGASTGSSGGYIKSINYTYVINGITFSNMTTAKYTSSGGDSGGIIYTYISSSNIRYTVGIHKGTTTISGVKAFTKADLALNALGLERY